MAAAATAALALTGITVAGSPVASAASTVVLADTFGRVVSGGWGNAETGGAWTVRGGSADQYNVDGSAATISMGAGELPNVDAKGVVALDTDMRATVAVDRTADTNNGTYATLVSRRRSTSEQYAAILSLATNPPLIQIIRRDSKAAQLNIGTTALLPGALYRAGDRWTLRFATSGTNPTTLRAKAWPISSPEPADWTVTRTDSTPTLQSAGSPGFSAYLSRRATNGDVLVSVFDISVTATTLCSAPDHLAAVAGDGHVALSWAPVAGADGYQVRRNGALVAATAATTFDDSGLANGASYTYTVAATNALGSGPSATVAATPLPVLPGTPTGVTATAGDGRVMVAWTAVAGAAGYRVYRDGSVAATTTATTFTDTGVTNGTTYEYAVEATNAAGASAPSSALTVRPLPPVPAAPNGLSALPGDRSVRLSWTQVPNATAYDVLRDGAVVASTGTASFADAGLTNGTTYGYSVVARNLAGASATSSVVTATPVPPIPAVPGGLSAVAASSRVTLTWNPVASATSYSVYRDGARIAVTATATLADAAVVNGTSYAYSVTASNASGTSASSAVVLATPLPPAPSTPTGLTATPGGTTIALAWSAVTGATGYVIRRDGVVAASVTGTSYTDTGHADGASHSYTVAATNLGGSSAYSNAVTAAALGTSSIPAPPAGWTTTFEDDFTGTAVDGSKWNVRNNSANSNEQSYLLSRNVTVTNGLLNVSAKREAVGGKAYTSGYLDSIGKFSQRYGIWQVRAKVNTPIGSSQGMWPAPLWLRGDTSPMEVDLIEAWGTGPTVLNGYRAGSGSASIHQDTNGGGGKVSTWLADAGTDLSAGFHVYEVEWEPTFMAVRVDGVEKVRATPTNAPWIFTGTDYAGNANMRVNLQVSKDTAYYGGPIASTSLPSTMQIDYIRVMKKS